MATETSEAVRVCIPILQQEKSYKHWRNAILIWGLITEVKPEKQALVVALNLGGRERELALNIDSAELNKKTGLTTLLNLLEEEIQGFDAYRTFQRLDNLRKSPLQSMHVYVNSFKIFYENAEALGSSIPDKILAYKLLNGSGLSQENQEKILETTEIISVARISAALLSAGDWPRTKAFPETTANGSKQLQPICTQPNKSQQLRTPPSSLSNTSSKFTFSASNGQTRVASADSTVKETEVAASASTKDSSKNIFPGFSFSATSLKNSSNGKQEVKLSSNLFSSFKSSLKKTNEDSSATDHTKPLPATGPLKVDKKPGKWNCSDCYTENKRNNVICLCCGKANPNAPAAPKAECTATKPGLFGFGFSQKTSSSFGIQQTTPNSARIQQQESKPGSNPISPSKFSFGKTNTTTHLTSDSTKPKLLSVGEEENSDDDSDAPVSHPAVTIATATSTTAQTSESSTFGFNIAAGFSFADLVQSNPTGGFGSSANSGGWVGMTKQKALFANFSQHETSQDSEEHYENDEADNIHFEPLIKLPDKIETVTGEEDEETLYTQRCKLYRFDKPTNEWKERGLGVIKFLKHHKTGKIRIVMRREQVFKVCANHYIRPGMTLDPNKTSDRAWIWTAMDFTDEGEPKPEVFTARFKNVEVVKEFKEKFDMCQTMLLDADPMTPCKANSMRSRELSQKAEKMKNKIRFFKDKFSQPSKVDLDNTITDEATLQQKPTPPVGSLTPLVAQHTESLRKSAAQNILQDSIFETPQKPKSLGSIDNKFSFHAKSSNLQENDNSSQQQREHTMSAGSDDPQTEKDIHFEPIVQLPEKVDLVTGEEDEQVIFGNRAKLYTFHKESKQWKERALGEVKILQDLSSCRVRVVMRQEKVLKVRLNHLLKSEYKLIFKELTAGNIWLWMARDFSDVEKPDGEVLQFALRFLNTEVANSFKNLWVSGVDAAGAKTLLNPDPSHINTSRVNSGVARPGRVVQSPTSPVKQPISAFSFANIPSPFGTGKRLNKGPVNVMGFVFGKPHETKSAGSSSRTFYFDTSNLSFNFTETCAPQFPRYWTTRFNQWR